MQQLALALLQLIIAVLLSAISAYLAFFLFQWVTRDMDEAAELRRGNIAIGMLLGAIVLSVAIVLRPALDVDASAWDLGREFIWRALLGKAVQIAVGLALAVIALLVALAVFAALTRGLDEIAELKKGNLAMAALLAGVVIAVGLMLSPAVAQLMDLAGSLLF
jgi:uncharacterized membrane protein YjfL (UPF0719 family)